jgi:hypothetical protein
LYAFVPLICSSRTDFVLLDRFGTLNALNAWFRILTEWHREVRGEKKNFTVSALFAMAVHVLIIFFQYSKVSCSLSSSGSMIKRHTLGHVVVRFLSFLLQSSHTNAENA